MWEAGKETWRIIRSNLKNIMLFELIYRLMTMPLYLTLAGKGIGFALKMAGYSYLTAGNIGRFLLKPWTLVVILALAVLGTFLLFVEVAGLITAFQGGAYSRRPGVSEIFVGAMVKLLDEAKKKNWKLLVFVLIHYFLMQLGIIYRTLTHIKPINFVLVSALEDPIIRWIMAVVLILLMMIAIPAVFLYHGCTIEQKSFRDGLAKSTALLKGRALQAVGVFFTLNVIVIFFISLVYVMAVIVTAVGVTMTTDGNMSLAVLLYSCDRIEIVLLFFASIFMVIVNLAGATVLYYQSSSKKTRDVSWDFSYPDQAGKNRRMIAGAVGGLCIVSILFIGGIVQDGFAIAKNVLTEVQITAHRGSSKSAPENTMAALMVAVEEMADYVEIDVQETGDGQLVLLHDSSLKRTTGVSRAVKTLTLKEVEELDAGSWFSESFAGEKIPTLNEVLEFSKGKILLNIEIKNVGTDSELPKKVLQAIQQYEMEEQCVISSTNLSYLKIIKELEPDIKTGYIISAAYGNYYSNEAVDFISIRSSFVNERLIDNAHQNGKTVHAWTVNSQSEIERMKMLGVDNIITDYPVQAREIVYGEPVKESILGYLSLVLK